MLAVVALKCDKHESDLASSLHDATLQLLGSKGQCQRQEAAPDEAHATEKVQGLASVVEANIKAGLGGFCVVGALKEKMSVLVDSVEAVRIAARA